MPEYALGQRHSCGEPCSILIYIEGPVEVGNPRPLNSDIVVKHNLVAIVIPVQLRVDIVEHIRRQSLARFKHLMGYLLELRKQSLPVKRASELFKEVVEQVHPSHRVLGQSQQVPHEQHFVGGGSNLRQEYGVVGVHIGLSCPRVM